MKDDYFKTDLPQDGPERAGLPASAVRRFADDVIARLVSQSDQGGDVLRTALVDQVLDWARSPDPASFDLLRAELKRLRISAECFADHYIPEVARLLGRGWEDDRYGFAEVTMGVARLQAVLREVGATWKADALPYDAALPQGAGVVLVIIPEGEQHTLGAMVLSAGLRRRGVSVCLRIAPKLDEVAELVATKRFDGALLSLAGPGRLETCQAIIKTIKQAPNTSLKVAVGGAILELEAAVYQGIGADIVTNDLSVALAVFGLDAVRDAVEAVK